jgi:hypothetical protein
MIHFKNWNRNRIDVANIVWRTSFLPYKINFHRTLIFSHFWKYQCIILLHKCTAFWTYLGLNLMNKFCNLFTWFCFRIHHAVGLISTCCLFNTLHFYILHGCLKILSSFLLSSLYLFCATVHKSFVCSHSCFQKEIKCIVLVVELLMCKMNGFH